MLEQNNNSSPKLVKLSPAFERQHFFSHYTTPFIMDTLMDEVLSNFPSISWPVEWTHFSASPERLVLAAGGLPIGVSVVLGVVVAIVMARLFRSQTPPKADRAADEVSRAGVHRMEQFGETCATGDRSISGHHDLELDNSTLDKIQERFNLVLQRQEAMAHTDILEQSPAECHSYTPTGQIQDTEEDTAVEQEEHMIIDDDHEESEEAEYINNEEGGSSYPEEDLESEPVELDVTKENTIRTESSSTQNED